MLTILERYSLYAELRPGLQKWPLPQPSHTDRDSYGIHFLPGSQWRTKLLRKTGIWLRLGTHRGRNRQASCAAAVQHIFAEMEKELLAHRVSEDGLGRISDSWAVTALPVVLLGLVASPLTEEFPSWLHSTVGSPTMRWGIWLVALVTIALALTALGSWLTPNWLTQVLTPPYPRIEFAGCFSTPGIGKRAWLRRAVRQVIIPVITVIALLALFIVLAPKP